MKVLSIEEKAKHYDEALERAKNFIENGDERERTIAESIFAGLMEESEDERIMRCIGMCLTDANEQRFIDYSISLKDCLDWLEKQGENSVCKVKIGETYKCIDLPRYTCFRMGDIYHVKDNFVAELINICSDCFVLLEKQGEQKPAWSDDDVSMLYGVMETEQYMLDVVNGIKKFDVGNDNIRKECAEELNWIKSFKDRVQSKQ